MRLEDTHEWMCEHHDADAAEIAAEQAGSGGCRFMYCCKCGRRTWHVSRLALDEYKAAYASLKPGPAAATSVSVSSVVK